MSLSGRRLVSKRRRRALTAFGGLGFLVALTAAGANICSILGLCTDYPIERVMFVATGMTEEEVSKRMAAAPSMRWNGRPNAGHGPHSRGAAWLSRGWCVAVRMDASGVVTSTRHWSLGRASYDRQLSNYWSAVTGCGDAFWEQSGQSGVGAVIFTHERYCQ